MKILYCTHDITFHGGLEHIVLQKVNYMIKNYNYKITILSEIQNNKELFYNYNKKIVFKNLNIIEKKNIFYRWKEKIKYYIKIKKLIKDEKYDVIISTGFFLDKLIPFLNKDICTIREYHFCKNYYKNMPNYSKSKIKFYQYLNKKNYLLFKKFIVLTLEDKKEWDDKRIKVISNFLTFYSEQLSKCDNKKIISVGRLYKEKGYDILIDVWNIVFKKYPDWILEIYGEGEERENLQNKINKLGLEKSFLLKGAVKNIQDKYLESSIYVMSSRCEGFGMVLLEAMACGLPVVSFDCPCGPKDIIKDNEDGFLVKFGNIEQMAEKIEELITDQEKRKQFGKNAKKNIQRYSQDKIMNQWKELFQELVRNK